MKCRPAVFFSAVLLFCSMMAAQNIPTATPPKEDDPANSHQPGTANPNNPAPPENAPTNASNAKAITIQGCLSGGKQAYTLFQQGTGAGFELESKSYQLKNARGKLVQITGHEMPPNNKSDNLPRLEVEGLQIMSDHCELPGKASGASTSVPHRNHNNPANTTQPDAAVPRYESSGAPDQTPPNQGNNPTNWGRTSGAPSPGTGNPPPSSTPPK
jgi:hypothetical protein